jgi:hypothetical protein
MKRLLLLAVVAAVAAVPAQAATPTMPIHSSGSSIGEGTSFKAYATISPTVHLFGDSVTAKVAVVADTKWVDPARVRVRTDFAPYEAVRDPQLVRLRIGRFEQMTWIWTLRCLGSPCVPRVPHSDTSHVFHFPPAHIDYVNTAGKRLYGINAYWPPVEVVSQVAPGVKQILRLTNRIKWQFALGPVAKPTYRVSPTVVLWLAVGLAGLLALAAVVLAGLWIDKVRPRAEQVELMSGTPLERVLAVLRYAHETGDETLQRKAFERVADELGPERAAELAGVARELAWSPRTPADEEVEEFATKVSDVQEDDA